jgi:hypothetical protein
VATAARRPTRGRLRTIAWFGIAVILAIVAFDLLTMGSLRTGLDPPDAAVPPPRTQLRSVWVDPARIRAQPMSGAAWNEVVADADRLAADGSGANVSDQDSNHDQLVLAAAIACVRTDDAKYCVKARGGVVAAIGTEADARWLAIGRNVGSYVIAADLLGLRADADPTSDGSRADAWIRSFLQVRLQDNNNPDMMVSFAPFRSGSNASAQEGFVYAAVAAYADDDVAVTRAWDAFRTYACDPGAPDREQIDVSKGVEYGWSHDAAKPCAVNPAGTTKVVPTGYPGAGQRHRIDGAIINDMRRGGFYQHPPGYTDYPWPGLEGFVPAAMVLHRAGYPAFSVADNAVYRAMDYLWHLRNTTGDSAWFDGERADETIHLVNTAYNAAFPITTTATGAGRTVGYVDYTHPGP